MSVGDWKRVIPYLSGQEQHSLGNVVLAVQCRWCGLAGKILEACSPWYSLHNVWFGLKMVFYI
jgi:hypothetical protein